jgi:CubicO group peptidase (beta-lactamase class C family)
MKAQKSGRFLFSEEWRAFMDARETILREVVEPADVGIDPDRLRRVVDSVNQDISDSKCDGAVLIVARQGEVVLREAVGKTDLEKNRPARLDDMFCLQSITKQLTAVKVLMDIEAGKFTLDTPICEVIPEFGQKGKQGVTVKHVMTHTSGLNSEIPFGLPVHQLGNIETVTKFMSNDRIFYRPGTVLFYNPVCSFALLAVMVQRLDEKNRPFRKILQEDLFLPLGMNDTVLGLPEEVKDRYVPVVFRDRSPGAFSPIFLEAFNVLAHGETEMPSNSGLSTALDIFRFAEMLRRGGELDGTRILSPETVELATKIHTGDLVNRFYDYARVMHGWPEFPANFGLTFFIRGEGMFPMPLGLTASPESFAGLGAGSNMFLVDPQRDLTFVFLSAGLMEEINNQLRCQRLADLVIASVKN